MNSSERLQLQNMCRANNVIDQTELIRNLKHSVILRENINNLIMLKAKYIDDFNNDDFNLDAMMECNFLYTYYTDIYNKIKKDEIDLSILYQLLDVLRDIEEEKIDQHDGSYNVGMLLRKIYVDSALKKANKLNAENEDQTSVPKQPTNNISWKEYKHK